MRKIEWLTEYDGKPLERKAYGSIPHLPGSRLGPGEHTCHEGQARIATVKTRSRYERVIVQEKLDGSNVSVARIDGKLIALTRAGYLATSSPYEMHHVFAKWCMENEERFDVVLKEGERIVGEWLYQAHGTRYKLHHEPFVAFDIMRRNRRMVFDAFIRRANLGEFVTPHILHIGGAFSIDEAMDALAWGGFHGAIDPPEGAVWRVESSLDDLTKPLFIVKYVRPDKEDGKYLKCVPPILNSWPEHCHVPRAD